MKLFLRFLVIVIGLASVSACSGSHMDPIQNGGDAPGDIQN